MALHHYLHASSHKMKHADPKSLSDQLKDSTKFFLKSGPICISLFSICFLSMQRFALRTKIVTL